MRFEDVAAELDGKVPFMTASQGRQVYDHIRRERATSVLELGTAFGASALLLETGCADPFSRRAVRVSMGNVLKVRYAEADQWPQALYELDANGFETFALTPYPPAVDLKRIPTGAAKVAVLVGAEGPGLEATSLADADIRVRIPIDGEIDSLNVVVAAGIALERLRR